MRPRVCLRWLRRRFGCAAEAPELNAGTADGCGVARALMARGSSPCDAAVGEALFGVRKRGVVGTRAGTAQA